MASLPILQTDLPQEQERYHRTLIATWVNELVKAVYIEKTESEASAGINPVDYTFQPGDVRRYGATFDGTTNDTTAIQNAFDSGHDVFFPEGTAVIDATLTVEIDNITISGFSKHGTIIKQTGSDVHGIRVNANGVTLRDFTVRDITQTGAAEFRGIYVPGSDDVTVERVKVLNTGDSGISIGFISDGNDPSLIRSERCRVIDCDVENATGPGSDGIGIELIGAIDVLVRGCTTKDTKRFGIRCVACTRATITDNNLSDFAQLAGDAGINISAGTIPGPANTECIDVIVANNQLRLDTARGAGTFMGVQILGAKRAMVIGNRITLSDVAGASTDFRAIDIQNGSTGIENDSCVISSNIINGTDLNVGVQIQHVNNNIKIIGNIIEGVVGHGIRSTATDLTGEVIGNTVLVGGASARAISKSASAAGKLFCWGNTTDATDNLPFDSNNDSFVGRIGGFTQRVTRSGNNLDMSGAIPHPLETGNRIRFTTTGTLPAPLATATDYYAIRVDDDTIQAATTMSNAVAGTAIVLTDAGTGNHSVEGVGGPWANAVR